jgi:hypothetical protein
MRQHLKRRPRGFVVAAIVLVIAMAGTAIAGGPVATISKVINGHSIKKKTLPGNRLIVKSTPGNRLKDDTLTGQQINESTLGQVPSAANANSANNATNANSANNADKLDNLNSSAFERSTKVQLTRVPIAATPQTLVFEWPELGVRVTTDGDVDANEELRFLNTRTTGNIIGRTLPGGPAFGPAPGQAVIVGDTAADGRYEAYVISVADTNLFLHIECFFGAAGGIPIAWCEGVRSRTS